MPVFKKKNIILEKLKDKFLSEQELLDLLPYLKSSELYLLTKQVWITPKVLAQAAKLANDKDLDSLLCHPKFPVRELKKYAESSLVKNKKSKVDSEYVLYSIDNYEAIASNLNCPGELLELLYGTVSDEVDNRIASHPNLPNKLFKQIIKDDDIEILKKLCLNPILTNTQLNTIFKLKYTILDKYISQNPNLDEENFGFVNNRSSENLEISNQKIKKVKNIKLDNKSLLNDLDELHKLSRDESTRVRVEVAKNSLLPSKSLEEMIKSENELEVLLTIFENQYLDSRSRTLIEKRLEEFDWPYKQVDPRFENRYKLAMDDLTENY
jgi:hypothetical protein